MIVNRCCSSKDLNLIDNDSRFQGFVPLIKALQISKIQKLDLVRINTKNNFFLCKVINFNKYKYKNIKKKADLRI